MRTVGEALRRMVVLRLMAEGRCISGYHDPLQINIGMLRAPKKIRSHQPFMFSWCPGHVADSSGIVHIITNYIKLHQSVFRMCICSMDIMLPDAPKIAA